MEPSDPQMSADLIFDIGLHKGEDTEFYLKKGFRVIAIEADPEHAAYCRSKFAEHIATGKLNIVEGAVVDMSKYRNQTTIRFYKNSTASDWGTVCESWAERNEIRGAPSHTIEVDIVDLRSLLVQHGIPRYMKIDIEGCDMLCLKALCEFQTRPKFVSIECNKADLSSIREELKTLVDLGYDAFKAVQQSAIPEEQIAPDPAREGSYCNHRFVWGASGLFGEELPGKWKSRGEISVFYFVIWFLNKTLGESGLLRVFALIGLRAPASRVLRVLSRGLITGWWDTHARHSGR